MSSETTTPVRTDEGFDAKALQRYLSEHLEGCAGSIEIEQFPGGHSNLTYLVRCGEREWVLRRPPLGATVASAHDMGREYRVLSKLHAVYPKAPEPQLFCEDADILGATFYLMRRIEGVVYRARKPKDFDLGPHRVRDACYEFIESLAELHLVEYEAAGLESLYKGPGYLERQMAGWEKRWAHAKTHEVREMDRVRAWLVERRPAQDYGATIIHNDFKFDNLVFDPERGAQLVGVLDWEMATIGDPLSDFATTLTTWRQTGDEPSSTVAACFMYSETGALTRDEIVRIYGRRTGFDLSDLLWYYVFAMYKGAIILQQIYYRYHHGHTRDERFATLGDVANAMVQRAATTLESERF